MRQTVQPHYEFPEIPSLPEKKWNVEDKLDQKDVCLSSFFALILKYYQIDFWLFFFASKNSLTSSGFVS